MKRLFTILSLLFTINALGQITTIKVGGAIAASDGAVTLSTVSALQSYGGGSISVIVRDTLRGGVFNYVQDATVDNGVVFAATGKGSGYWVRQYEKQGVNIEWFGAVRNTDIVPVLHNILFHTSYNEIVVPDATFNMDSQLGFPGNTIFNDTDSLALTRDVSIIGIGNATIKYTGAATQAMFELSVRANLTFNNLTVDGNNVAVRGLYAAWFTTHGNLTVEGCNFKNFRTPSTAFLPAVAIRVMGNINTAYFNRDSINNVTAAVGAMYAGAPLCGLEFRARGDYYVKNLIVTNSFIGNVYSLDTAYAIDQDGIQYLQFPYITDTFQTHSVFTGNTFKNCRTRFLKIQAKNTYVHDNAFIIDSMYSYGGISVDLQYSEGVVSSNHFTYKTYSHSVITNFTNRDTMLSRTVFKNNKVKAYGNGIAVSFIVQNYNTGNESRLGNLSITDNTVSVDSVDNFANIIVNGLYRYNKIIVSGNTIEKINSSLINLRYAETSLPGNVIKITANDNTNKWGDVPLVTNSNNYVGWYLDAQRNIGFTDSVFSLNGSLKIIGLYPSRDASDMMMVKKADNSVGYREINQTGSRPSLLDGIGALTNPQWWNTQDTGTSSIAVSVNDGVNNNRLGLFVDHNNRIQGLSSLYSSGAMPFIYMTPGGERFRVGTNGHFSVGTTNTDSMLNVGGGLRLSNIYPSSVSTDSFLVRKTNLGVGYTFNPTKIGASLSIFDGAGTPTTPQIWNTQTSGTASIAVGVNDGTFQRRMGLFVDHTNSVQGISATYGSTAIPFVFLNAGTERFRVSPTGNFGIGSTTTTSLFNVGSAAQFQVNSSGNIVSGGWNGSTITEGYGGTDQTTYTAGDMLYASATNTLSKLPVGSSDQVLQISGGVPTWQSLSGSGITTLNTLSGATQTFAVGTSGTDFAISSSGTAHTFNLPDASATNRGAVTTAAQAFAGVKTFNNAPILLGFQTTTTSVNSDLISGSTGATLLSGAAASYTIGGVASRFRVGIRGSVATTATAADNVFALLIGDNAYTEAASGTSAIGAGVGILTQTFTNGSGSTTDFQNLYVGDAPTGGTNNYSINAGASIFRSTVTATQFKLSALNAAPANAGDTGTTGEIRIVNGFIYICVATNTWQRAAIATW